LEEKGINILDLNKISFSYNIGENVLTNCCFSVKKGSICAIFGESGSGKSTLLRLIAGLERPGNGEIKIENKIVSDDSFILAPQKREVGLVFQDYSLFPHLTVSENISFGIKENNKEIVEKLIKKVKMVGFEGKYPNELSGGQQQRIAIARTLALNPKLLLLDEPFSNLDSELKTELRREIKKITKEINTSLIFITHDIIDAIDIADEIIFIKNGEIIRHCSLKNIFDDIKNDFLEKTKIDLKHRAEIIMNIISQNY
tara:strand:+ start:2015 stop:2785 length:771 start_codon:yes stop_codon:yes gene_type:complete